MTPFRTPESHKRYHDLIAQGLLEKGCALCAAPALKEFVFWRIINNEFPYDRVAKVHHMIIPKRHIQELELTEEERAEYKEIKKTDINENYEYIVEAVDRKKTIPAHFHLHLVVGLD